MRKLYHHLKLNRKTNKIEGYSPCLDALDFEVNQWEIALEWHKEQILYLQTDRVVYQDIEEALRSLKDDD